MTQSDGDHGPVVLGGVAALLASAYCLGPLLLAMTGVSGAWNGSLAALEPYRPAVIGMALLAIFFAYRRIFRRVACSPDATDVAPRIRTVCKPLFWMVAALVLLAIAFPYAKPLLY